MTRSQETIFSDVSEESLPQPASLNPPLLRGGSSEGSMGMFLLLELAESTPGCEGTPLLCRQWPHGNCWVNIQEGRRQNIPRHSPALSRSDKSGLAAVDTRGKKSSRCFCVFASFVRARQRQIISRLRSSRLQGREMGRGWREGNWDTNIATSLLTLTLAAALLPIQILRTLAPAVITGASAP